VTESGGAVTLARGPACLVVGPEPCEPAPMLRKVAFTMYPVEDAARARAFYEEVLGLSRGAHSEDGVWTEYDLPNGGCLALFKSPELGADRDAGVSVAFEVEDLDAVNARLRAAGVEYKQDMIHSPVCRMSVILDSEGNAIILHELKRD
jgi:predicted enzyme related to lactoylglutathione lyase